MKVIGYTEKGYMLDATKEEIDEVITPFITNKVKVPNQEIYLSSKEIKTNTYIQRKEKLE